MQIKAVIIDDMARARKYLEGMIQKYFPEVEIAGMADNISSGAKLIREQKPDLVFLDVEMPGGSGFELFDQLDTIDFEVIFTTAHDQYAIQAFRYSALDYLLKPLKKDDLGSAIRKAIERKSTQAQTDNLRVLLENLKQPQAHKQKLILPGVDGFTVVRMEEIIRIEAVSNYSKFHLLNSQPIMVSKNLGEYEKLLPQTDFIRIHKSHLINIHHVRKFARGSARFVIMADDAKLEVSKRKKDEFLDIISRL